MNKKRILQILMQTGIFKRSDVKKILSEGKVTVDDLVVTSEHYFVKQDAVVKIEGKEPEFSKEPIYIMLNKPAGYSCQKGTTPNVLDLVPEKVFAIGRLDKYTEGLLLLTNDGVYAHSILQPEHHIEKEYEAVLEKEISEEALQVLQKGVNIKLNDSYYLTKPCIVKKINSKKILVILTEGKKRQIRKMLKAVGNKVLELKRIRIGSLHLQHLELGKYKILTKEEAMNALLYSGEK